MPWVLFRVPCPTPDGRSARDLYERRLAWITPAMQASEPGEEASVLEGDVGLVPTP